MYRLTVGYLIETEVQAVDEKGEPMFEEGAETFDEEAGTSHLVQGRPVMVPATQAVPIEEFAFSAEDPKWEGKPPDEIVREQRKLVRAALRKRQEDAESTRRLAMPGVGDAL
jgi:hypothetical protein